MTKKHDDQLIPVDDGAPIIPVIPAKDSDDGSWAVANFTAPSGADTFQIQASAQRPWEALMTPNERSILRVWVILAVVTVVTWCGIGWAIWTLLRALIG